MFQRFSRTIVSAGLVMVSTAVLAVVSIQNPGGTPAANQSVTITLPGNIEREGETDDDGILFWLDDGSKADSLPEGALVSGGYSYTNVSTAGMSTTTKVLIGAAAVGAAIAIADDGDSGSNSGSDGGDTGSGGDSGGDSGGSTDPAVLEVSPSSLSISRTEGDTPCPAPMGSVMVSNGGVGDMTYTVSSPPAGFSYDAMPTTLGEGQSESFDVNFDCSPDESTSGSVTIEGTDSGSGASAGTSTVNLSASVSAASSPGELQISSVAVDLGSHDPNSTPCQEPRDRVTLTNVGGETIEVTLDSSESFIGVDPSGSFTLSPGDSVEVTINFNCNGSGFSYNSNNRGFISVSVVDLDGNSVSGGGSIDVTVFVESSG